MKAHVVALRGIALAACLLTIGTACSSTDTTSRETETTKAPASTTDPNETPNSIPFDLGARVGLPNGWIVTIVKVRRPYSNPQLPEPDDGREYVAVDMTMENQGTERRAVDAAALFELGDSTGGTDQVVAVPDRANGIDGSYPPQTKRSGQLVFEVPARAQLRMAMDGPLIGTKKAIFMVDPPTVPAVD
jgi:hypothetical protein